MHARGSNQTPSSPLKSFKCSARVWGFLNNKFLMWITPRYGFGCDTQVGYWPQHTGDSCYRVANDGMSALPKHPETIKSSLSSTNARR